VLIVQEHLWILAIESKRVQLDVMAALPQLLVYLLTSPAIAAPRSDDTWAGICLCSSTQNRKPAVLYLLRHFLNQPPPEFQTVLSVLQN
jgi:hypothetical protein